MSKIKRNLKGLGDVAKNKATKVIGRDSKVGTKTRDIATGIQSGYLNTGAKGKVDAVQSQISEKLDEISGQEMYQLVQERLVEQERFNDLVATKLQEAHERIAELEKQLSDK